MSGASGLGSLLWLAGAFLAFMAVIGAAHALDRRAGARFGYRPLALPNLAFMLIPHGVLAAGVFALWSGTAGAGGSAGVLSSAAGPGGWLLAALGLGAAVFMGALVGRRTGPWTALGAVVLMTLAASVLIPSVLFREVAEGPRGPGG